MELQALKKFLAGEALTAEETRIVREVVARQVFSLEQKEAKRKQPKREVKESGFMGMANAIVDGRMGRL